MDATPIIRRASAADAQTTAAIHRASAIAGFADVFPQDRFPFPEADERKRWEARVHDPEVEVVLAELEGVPVGVAALSAEWLKSLFVVPERWGSGVGGTLHDYALERFRSRGFAECHLWVLEANAAARAFYERRGWHENGRARVAPFPPNPRVIGYSRRL